MNPDLEDIFAELEQARGIAFHGYRPGTLQRRLSFRMGQLGIRDSAAYLHKLRTDPAEPDRLVDAVGVRVSHFFRDAIVFENLAGSVLPRLIERRGRGGPREIRVWSAGCASGEEAYSVAILIHQALQKEAGDWRVFIFASDMNGEALRQAERGDFSREKFEETKLGVLDRYFDPTATGFRVKPFVREMVQFCRDDLTSAERTAPSESIFGTFDLVLCRNVLIYFQPEPQAGILCRLRRSLGPGGFLVLGSSEDLSGQLAEGFVPVDRPNRIWRKVG
ncbi:protein-glutamate O-methyltransferase CheR [Desulfuromonas sp.]|uniref:CheR family methyltransferase n=1 Tax=Desulfuromonas sp. TaxID=892 RepID=UPI0025B92E0F|nr:protein-glutamate O-methyltransferase CheR [Desulfuromonas sp.]